MTFEKQQVRLSTNTATLDWTAITLIGTKVHTTNYERIASLGEKIPHLRLITIGWYTVEVTWIRMSRTLLDIKED